MLGGWKEKGTGVHMSMPGDQGPRERSHMCPEWNSEGSHGNPLVNRSAHLLLMLGSTKEGAR